MYSLRYLGCSSYLRVLFPLVQEARKNAARVDKQLADHQAMLKNSNMPSASSVASGSGSGSAESNREPSCYFDNF